MNEGIKIGQTWTKYAGSKGNAQLMKEMNVPNIDLLKAKLCVGCDVVYDGDECPRCESHSFIWLSRALGRVAQENYG